MTIRFMATSVVICLASSVSAATLTENYTSFYSFGDSLTDDGKFGTLPPPSNGGRFSNGPVWSEYVEQEFENAGLDTGNLALGGATSGNVNINSTLRLSTLDGQVEIFAEALVNGTGLPTNAFETADTGSAPAPGLNPLVSLWFGANNIFQLLDPTLAAQSISQGIRAIAAINPRTFDDFLVARIGYFSDLPAFAGAPAFGAQLDRNIDTFNAQLTLEIAGLRTDGFNVIDFDSAPVFADIIDDIENNSGGKYGIIDANTPCTASFSPSPSSPNTFLCDDPNLLLFNDSVHPNAVAQRLIGAAALAAITPSPVPLPAGLPLLLVGLGALGAIRMRGNRKAA